MKRSLLRIALPIGAAAALLFGLLDRTPHGTECRTSRSPDGEYTAERCLLDWVPGGDSEYVGRVFDAASGRKLAQRRFRTAASDLIWSDGVCASDSPGLPLQCTDPGILFSSGDPSSGDAWIPLPPSWRDRLLAARPRP